MIIDNRTLLFNGHLSSKQHAKKSLQTSIGNTSVASTEHKSIDLGFKNHSSHQNTNQADSHSKKQNEESEQSPEINLARKVKVNEIDNEKNNKNNNKDLKSVRDPLLLLKAF